ncbi:MAG: class I mannose-6-phosphate isomerase [Oscillospiraceae bacterium]|nr:class I mannose-6-phosphate isomerase [Oscillospiraceae bacterium]
MKPFLLKGVCKDYIWGGNRLRDYGKTSDADRIAESWELSCHPDGESVLPNGSTLTQYLKEHPEALGVHCADFDRFPVLVKLIDAADNLSVQVHPDDAYAMQYEGAPGKTELWYVIDAQPDAELIYGFREAITKDEFRRAIETHTLLDKVKRVPVKAGDVFYIPAGTLHAIGKGILIAEIQENSNTTYRVYDYGRVDEDGKPRALHIEKALDVTSLCPTENTVPSPSTAFPEGCTIQTLGACRYFEVMKITVQKQARLGADTSFNHILVLDGTAVLRDGAETLSIRRGDSIFVPAGTEHYSIENTGESACTLIFTEVYPVQ